MIALLLGTIILSVWAFPYFKSLTEEQARQEFIHMIQSQGIMGVAILSGMQALQIIIVVIPAGMTQVLAGAIYGVWGGYLVCTLGNIVGSVFVLLLVKKLGEPFVHRMIPQNKLQRFSFLYQQKKLSVIVFILFFIPGVPKDLLTYLIPLTTMPMLRFLVITTIARTPSILTGTLAGAEMAQGLWVRSIIIFLIPGLIGLIGLKYKDRAVAAIKSHQKRQSKK